MVEPYHRQDKDADRGASHHTEPLALLKYGENIFSVAPVPSFTVNGSLNVEAY
jgi:hypothetical protein